MLYKMISKLFFFFKQKTAYEMRISDWSSDVCSSDLDDATVRHMVDNQVKGGWSSPLGPYKGAGQWWTERHNGLALEHLVSAYELTGSPATKQHIDELLGWLFDHQQAPPEGDPVTGAWTHSWQAHEGESYDPATDGRGDSPWMSANIVRTDGQAHV